jgi:nucleotide-binding universal stress UspA family protein
MYSNVIIAVDGREGGRDAAALARVLTARECSLALVYASTSGADPTLDDEPCHSGALAELLTDEPDLCGGTPEIKRVTALSIGAGLEQVAARRGAQLIIVGASRRHAINRLFSRDGVSSVMHHTPCAVAVAPAGFAENPRVLSRIGVAYDGSAESEVALAHAGLLAADHRSLLLARHVVEPRVHAGAWGTVPPVDADAELAAARLQLGPLDAVELEHVYGPVRELLLEFSREVDLLVCGSRHNGRMRRIAVGSTSDYLARHERTPLLIAPSRDAPSVQRWHERAYQEA